MPTYTFVCSVCGRRFDRVIPYQGRLGHPACPEGHTQIRRAYTNPAVVFKGSGWYSKDSRDGGYKQA